MEKQLHFFLIYFSAISVISITGVHYYIKDKLREKHDNGLLWVAAAVFIWILMGVLEFIYSCKTCEDPIDTINHIKNLPKEYWYLRKIFSIANSALFIYSLSFFKEGGLGWYKKFEKTNLGLLVLVTVCICLFTFWIEDKKFWIITESVVSSFVALLLCFSFSGIFFHRFKKIARILFSLLALSLAILLISTQLIEMIKEIAYFEDNINRISYWENESQFDDIVRMLSRPLLVINILGVAISWLGNQSEIMVVERDPASARLKFEQRGNRFFVRMSLDSSLSNHNTERKERIVLENIVFELNQAPFFFYRNCASEVKKNGDFRHSSPLGNTTTNFDTMIKHLLDNLNRQLEQDRVAGRPLTKLDLFKSVRLNSGIWTLVHKKDEIELGEEQN